MSIRVYIPRDSSALSLGAESVASAVVVEAARRYGDPVELLEAFV